MVVATPNHWHATMGVRALQAGAATIQIDSASLSDRTQQLLPVNASGLSVNVTP